MEKSLTTAIPAHWLIDTGPTIGWHLKEGIWVHKDHEPSLRVIAVYLELRDIPEAFTELQKAHQDFMVKFAKIIKWAEIQKALVLQKGTLKAFQYNMAPIDEEDVNSWEDIFMPWVNRWALGSKAMFQWIVAISVLEGIQQPLGLNRQQLRKANGKPSDNLLSFAAQFDPELEWAWKLLLSGEYHRAEQEARRFARCTVQATDYFRMRERTLLTHARYWIMVRILAIEPYVLLDKLAENSSKKDFLLTTNDLTERILKPFDDALGYDRKPGRPQKGGTFVPVKTQADVKMRQKT